MRTEFDTSGAESGPRRVSLVRFDSTLGGLLVVGPSEALPDQTVHECGALAAPFGFGYFPDTLLTCAISPGEEPNDTVTTGGGYGHLVAISGDTLRTSVKSVDTQAAGEALTSYAAGVGYLGFFARGSSLTLTYARVDGAELGAPFVVRAEGSPPEDQPLAIYPNPASRAFTVEFVVAAPGPGRIALFDALGRRVATLADGPLAPGDHRATFDASGLAPGPYVVRLDVGGQTVTRRVLLVR